MPFSIALMLFLETSALSESCNTGKVVIENNYLSNITLNNASELVISG